jgi:glycosyltransferase involved in cell wall biosynthesis
LIDTHELSLLKQFSHISELKIGYVGRIVEDKGVFLLVQSAIDLLNEGYKFKLLIAGSLSYDESYSRKLISHVAKYNANTHIEFLGEIKDTNRFYKLVNIVCIPSIYNEPSANVVVEAKYCVRPSILFNVGGTPELVTHLQDGYICNDVSVEALKNALLYYLKNSDIHLQQGKAAFESMKKRDITYKSFEKKWIDVFS